MAKPFHPHIRINRLGTRNPSLSSLKAKLHNSMYVGFEILTAVVMTSLFWDTTLCSRLKVNQCFGETYRLHLQGISQARNQNEASSNKSLYNSNYFYPT
jgi:hypothetical protein